MDAVNVQEMPPWRVHVLGCPRFDKHFAHPEEYKPVIDGPYVLFAGSTEPFDELSALKRIDEALVGSGLKLVYRPHPWRKKRLCADTVDPKDFNNLMLDPQIEEAYNGGRIGESALDKEYPDLGYYGHLLMGATFIAAPMSSLIMEAGLYNVPALILVCDDHVHRTSPKMIHKFAHFEGITNVPGWRFEYNMADIGESVKQMVDDYGQDNWQHRCLEPHLRNALRPYIHYDERLFAQRLNDYVGQIGCM